MSDFDLENIPSQKGRIAVVTGANVGLGFETAVGLAEKEFEVILACRNEEKAEAAIIEIHKRVPESKLVFMALDLNSLASVRTFADEFSSRYASLDLLINNAGIMMPPLDKTVDGFESQFGVNHLGHFLLTGLLLPLLEKTEGSRVVALSSIAHGHGTINFDNLNGEKYSRHGAYAQSKLACLMFAYQLQRRLEKKGSKTISVAAHPGACDTELGRNLPWIVQMLAPILAPLVTHPVKNGALPTLLAALGEDVIGGEYFGPTGFYEMKGRPGKVSSTKASHDQDVAARLWETSEKMTGISFL
jgi:NAD(P)-dependent dehydrogenase (short-subunit alcohol dehydrogenase family)